MVGLLHTQAANVSVAAAETRFSTEVVCGGKRSIGKRLYLDGALPVFRTGLRENMILIAS